MRLRCLIVDDSAALIDSLRSLLEREGLDVVGVASTPAEALRRIAEQRPDVALVDIDLGDASGFELVEEIARAHADAGPATILISAHEGADFADLIADSPALGFLPKSELSAAGIHALLDGSSGSRGTR
jgi:DNA-binding NarL/FixJ family response regulator